MQALGKRVIIKRDEELVKQVGLIEVIRSDTHGEVVSAEVISIGK